MNLYKTEAVVLRGYDLGEQDKVVLFYSPKYGRIRVVAKGARRVKSRFAPAIQPPSYDELIVHKSREKTLDILSECKIKYPFMKIRSSLVKFAYSSYLAELITRFAADEQPCPVLFFLLLKTLFLIEEAAPGQSLNLLIRSFELKLLDISGYRPCIERCVNCGKKIEFIKSAHFSAKLGGLLCEVCKEKNDRGALTISRQLVNLMHHLLHLRMEQVYKLKVKSKIERELEMVLKSFIFHLADGEMITLPFIRNFEKLEASEFQ